MRMSFPLLKYRRTHKNRAVKKRQRLVWAILLNVISNHVNFSRVGRLFIDVVHYDDDRRLLLPVDELTYLADDVVIP